jgi:hypothetical protein
MSFRNYGDYKKEDHMDHLARFCGASNIANRHQLSTNYYSYSSSNASGSSTYTSSSYCGQAEPAVSSNGQYMTRYFVGCNTTVTNMYDW